MSLSKQYLSSHTQVMEFDTHAFSEELRDACPEVVFAFLMGSSMGGRVPVGGDIDVALYVDGERPFELICRASDIIEKHVPGVHGDIGFLNDAEPVYRFEALKGRLLFTRDRNEYLSFFSLTCREYESQLVDYERQYRYRMGAA